MAVFVAYKNIVILAIQRGHSKNIIISSITFKIN